MRECGATWTDFDTLQPGDAVIKSMLRVVDGVLDLMCEGQGLVLGVKTNLDRAALPPCVEL